MEEAHGKSMLIMNATASTNEIPKKITFPALEKNSYTSLSSAFRGSCKCKEKKVIRAPLVSQRLTIMKKKLKNNQTRQNKDNLICKDSPLISLRIDLRFRSFFLFLSSA